MATRIPLLILDEIMLPGATTEVGLDPGEARHLASRGLDDGGALLPVAVVSRAPSARTATRLEQRGGDPGPLLAAGLVGEGAVAPPTEDDPVPRLVLERAARVRVLKVEADGEGWRATVEPWPYDRAGLDPADVAGLALRFYRALLASRGEEDEGLREQIERPVAEIAGTADPVTRLLLLADYLFERPDVRRAVMEAEAAAEVRDTVADALELLEEGLPGGYQPVREALRTWLREASREGVGELAGTARVLRALAPLLDPPEAVRAEVEAVAEAMEALERRFEAVATRLLERPGKKPRPRREPEGE